ncbi:MAG: multidrug efflux protein [Gammaproteobacteria bacterium RIFCSPHIGHO2_12_FULL_38_11]|nr:MAG: multidrug efflux protein [Gammaproteobacteria bacterium RIFCSPHIGHO2_12_FULL_38_11]
MNITDIFIRRPVLSIVLSLLILVLGIRSLGLLSIQQYPTIQSAVVTVSTNFIGADPATISAFITSPLENAIAQANGIDYMTSSSGQNVSNIQVNLLLNYDADKALTEINTQVNSVLNQLPANSQTPTLQVTVGQSIASMYLGYYSDFLKSNQINDYLLRVVQPKLQAVHGVQTAQILGNNAFAVRAWLNPNKLAGYGLTAADVGKILTENDFVTPAGRTDGQTFILNFNTNTSLESLNDFKNMVIEAKNGAIIRLKDIANVTLGSQNYNTMVTFNNKSAVYIGITVAPSANLLTVIDNVKKVFAETQKELPNGLNGMIVYDASSFVNSSIKEVIKSLIEAFGIVTVVVFLFLTSFRSLIIPIIAIPLSIVGTFFIMLALGYSINLLTLLALVLAIGLVVDDAIIVVENVHRHIEDGVTPFKAALMSAKELTKPIVAITVVLISVYLPIGFMGGLTGALFTEFAFTLAAAVTVSAVIALTLSPMMCSRLLKPHVEKTENRALLFINNQIEYMTTKYHNGIKRVLQFLPVVIVFAVVILLSNIYLFASSSSELAPQEDQGIIMAQTITSANASIDQMAIYSKQVANIFSSYSETQNTFQINGTSGANNAPSLNNSIGGMVLLPWDQRNKTTNQLQPILQKQINSLVSGAKVALFQPASLPGGGSGLPIQFVIQTTDPFVNLNTVTQTIVKRAQETGEFLYIDPDLKYDQEQTKIMINRDKIAQFGLTMENVGNSISNFLSENYVNYFDFMGRSYQVIPQVNRASRLTDQQLQNYYINTASGLPVSLATVTTLHNTIVPEFINHFQQLNSATISAVAVPYVSMGQALATLKQIADKVLPQGYTIDYGSQSRQYIQESSALIITFFLAMIIIYLALSALFNSFRDPLIILISVPLSICGAMIFVSLGVGGATLNIYTEVGLVTLIGLISKHGILIVEFANDEQRAGKSKLDAIISAAFIRFRPILMTTAAMVLGVVPLIFAVGASAISRFDIGLVIATGISIGTLFTLFVVPSMYLLIAEDLQKEKSIEQSE